MIYQPQRAQCLRKARKEKKYVLRALRCLCVS